MTTSAHKISSTSHSPLTRVLDSIDRGHARAAARAHTIRNSVHDAIEHGLDRFERRLQSSINRARARLERADSATADAIIRAQGAVGDALEHARHARTVPPHVSS
jgi:hypothetical protein